MAEPSVKPVKGKTLEKKLVRAKNEKESQEKCCPHEEPRDTNVIANITKLLPSNTFLMFQTLAPLATNDGHCGHPEIIMTSVMLIILASACMLVCFTDTVQINGKVYQGLVTPKGLWNPSFKRDPSLVGLIKKRHAILDYKIAKSQYDIDKAAFDEAEKKGEHLPNPVEPKKPTQELCRGLYLRHSSIGSKNGQYRVHGIDILHAVLSAVAFATLTMFTSPVSTCFYPNIPSTVVKTLPLLVGFVISAIFGFTPPARNTIVHPLPPTSKVPTDNSEPADPEGMDHAHEMPPQPPKGKGDHGQAAPVVAKLSKDILIPLALHEAAKSVPCEALVDALIEVGADRDSAIKVVQNAKDDIVTQMLRKLQAVTSEPLAEPSRQKSVDTQPLSLKHDINSKGSQSMSDTKRKEVLNHEKNSQVYTFSTPAIVSSGQDFAPLITTQEKSQPIGSPVNSQVVKSHTLNMAQGMANAGSQPMESVAIDIPQPPLFQPGSQMHAQLKRQASTSSPEMQAAKTMMPGEVSVGKFQQPSAADTHMALRQQGSSEFRDSQWMSTPPSNWPDDTSLTIENKTTTTMLGQQGVNHMQHSTSQLPHPMEEIVAQATTQTPTTFQVQTIPSKTIANTSQATRQVELANMTPTLRLDRPESTEITDSITTEEINSESESEPSNHGNFQDGSSNSMQGPMKRKL